MTAEKTGENEKCDTSCNLRGLVGYNADLCTGEGRGLWTLSVSFLLEGCSEIIVSCTNRPLRTGLYGGMPYTVTTWLAFTNKSVELSTASLAPRVIFINSNSKSPVLNSISCWFLVSRVGVWGRQTVRSYTANPSSSCHSMCDVQDQQ